MVTLITLIVLMVVIFVWFEVDQHRHRKHVHR